MRRFVAHIHDSDPTLIFDLKVKSIGFLTCFRVRLITCFWFDIGLPYLPYASITMRGIIAFIRDPVLTLTFDINDQGQNYRFLSYLCVKPITSVCFDIGISYLAHGSITMKGCFSYVCDHVMTLTFDLEVKFIGFITWLCVRATAFLSFDIVILCLARECITMVQCVAYIQGLCWTLTFDLNIKIIFPSCILVEQDRRYS